MASNLNNLYRFGAFRLDCRERALWRGEDLVSLPPKAFEVLCRLVEREGKIVSKDELMSEVWTDTFVEEGNLPQNIYVLRRALGKYENGTDYIETVPRRGYRFAAPVIVEEEERGKIEGEKGRRGEGELASNSDNPEPDSASKKETERETSSLKNSPSPLLPFSPSFFFIGVLAVLILSIIGARVYLFPSNLARSSAESPIEKISFQKLTFTGDVAFPVIAPDGKSFAYVRDRSIFLQETGSEKAARLNIPDTKVFGFLQFSPDGNSLYFRNQESFDLAATVFQVSRFGGAPRAVVENVWSGFAFSPDGKQISFVRFYPPKDEYALIVRNLESGAERALIVRKSPNSFFQDNYPAWTADGKRIAAVLKSPQPPFAQICVFDLETGETQTLTTPRLIQIEQLAWLADGRNLIASARENQKFLQLWRVSVPEGELTRLTNDLNIYRAVSLSADNKRMLVREYTTFSHIWVAPTDDLGQARQITFGNQNRDGAHGLAWTPEGNLVYVSRIIGNWDLWFLRPEEGARQRLTENAGISNLNPVASADGKHVFFSSNRSGSTHIWRTDASGENPVRITFSETEAEYFPAVSPDGAWLYYIQKSPKSSAIWRKSLVDGKAENLTAKDKVSPNNFLALSPDGKFLAFQNLTETSEPRLGEQIFRIGIIAAGEKAEPRFFNIKSTICMIRWTPDGKAFDYVQNTSRGAQIWRQPLDENGAPQLVLDLPKDFIFNFAWSADGKQLALARGQEMNDAMLLTDFNP